MKEGFRLKFTKCTFSADSVKYLGHIIQNNTIRPVKYNLISIRKFPTPKIQKNIRQFLGKINFYNEYIPKSALILDPLHNVLRKGQCFLWSEECQNSFWKSKRIIMYSTNSGNIWSRLANKYPYRCIFARCRNNFKTNATRR